MAGVVLEMKMKNDEKNKALEVAIGQIEKAFGNEGRMGGGRGGFSRVERATWHGCPMRST